MRIERRHHERRRKEPRPPNSARPAVQTNLHVLIAQHQHLAEAELASAKQAGPLENQAVHAARATAHATLALSYQTSILADMQQEVDIPEQVIALDPPTE